jgi:hypothetical protein
MGYKIGDILICSTNWVGTSYDLIIGDQYEILNSRYYFVTEFSRSTDDFKKHALIVKHIKSGQIHHWCDDKLFIPISIWRDFQLSKLDI